MTPTEAQRCIDARNKLNAAIHGEGAVIDDLERVVDEACRIIGVVHAALAATPQPSPVLLQGALTEAARDVLAERQRQISVEGWDAEHDDVEHDSRELARAAACYAYPELVKLKNVCAWPWGPDWWKPRDERRNLIRAGALILAEIERLDRALKGQP